MDRIDNLTGSLRSKCLVRISPKAHSTMSGTPGERSQRGKVKGHELSLEGEACLEKGTQGKPGVGVGG